jgi:N-succinyldiaminopimelate aminotransferase
MEKGAINLAQGFPDFDGPDEIKNAAIDAIKNGKNQYAPSHGIPELRVQLAKRQEKNTGISYDADSQVTVFSGATEAIYCCFQGLFGPGDEIIALAPFYDSYPASAFSAGAKLIGVPLKGPTLEVDQEAMAAAVNEKTKALIINTPHNPSGRVLTMAEMRFFSELALKHDLLVITDEVYEELVFEPAQHIFMATLPGMADRTITISSTSKTFSLTGWKIGYAFASPKLTSALRAVHQFTVFCSATPLQVGMVAALNLGDSYFESFRQEYKNRRELLIEILNENHFKCRAPDGTYFVLADYSSIKDVNDVEFTKWLIDEIGVACIPISGFYNDPKSVASQRLVRFGFCKNTNTLKQAGERLAKIKTLV